MDIRRRLRTPCTVTPIVDGDPDDYNNPTDDARTPFTTKCWQVQSGTVQSQGETTGIENVTFEKYNTFFRGTITLTARDQVTIDGVTFEIDGPPWYAKNPHTNQIDFIAANLVRTT